MKDHYRPQRSYGKVIFCPRGGGGEGACIVEGMRGMGGVHGGGGGMCGRGACMAGGGAVHGRGCVWQGGMCGMHTPHQILRDTVNEQAVCILLECILVFK